MARLFDRRSSWFALYVGAVLLPLAALALAATPAKHGFLWDLGVGLGFAGFVMMGVQFLLTARFRRMAAPFGIDLVYRFHRGLAYALLVLLLAHPAILLAVDPAVRRELDPLAAPGPVAWGTLSLLTLLALVATSVWRRPLRISYEAWRWLHLGLAVASVALAFAHVRGIDYYSGTPVVAWLWAGIGLSLAAALLHGRVVRPWRMRRRPWRVVSARALAGATWSVELAPDGHAGFGFQPGQFVWLVVRRSPFAMREHPFSIASAPRADGSLELAIKERGDFTRSLGTLRPGERAYVDGPYGSFTIDRRPDAPGYAFLAGGIGLAPCLGMLRALAHRGDPRPLVLVAAHDRWDRVPFRGELDALRARLDLEVVHVLEDPPEGWTGERGWLDRPMLERRLPPAAAGFEHFVCGPVPMTRLATRCLRGMGVPAARIHTEIFDLV